MKKISLFIILIMVSSFIAIAYDDDEIEGNIINRPYILHNNPITITEERLSWWDRFWTAFVFVDPMSCPLSTPIRVDYTDGINNGVVVPGYGKSCSVGERVKLLACNGAGFYYSSCETIFTDDYLLEYESDRLWVDNYDGNEGECKGWSGSVYCDGDCYTCPWYLEKIYGKYVGYDCVQCDEDPYCFYENEVLDYGECSDEQPWRCVYDNNFNVYVVEEDCNECDCPSGKECDDVTGWCEDYNVDCSEPCPSRSSVECGGDITPKPGCYDVCQAGTYCPPGSSCISGECEDDAPACNPPCPTTEERDFFACGEHLDPFPGCYGPCLPGTFCASGECNIYTGECEEGECPPLSNCDDEIDCTEDECTSGICFNWDDCPTGETCNHQTGDCDSGVVTCTPPDCDDKLKCTEDMCNSVGECIHKPKPCESGESCNPITGDCEENPECNDDITDCDEREGYELKACLYDRCIYVPIQPDVCESYEKLNDDGDCKFSISKVFTKDGFSDLWDDKPYMIYIPIAVFILLMILLIVILFRKSSNEVTL